MKAEDKKHRDEAKAVHDNKDRDQLRAQREDDLACGSFDLMQVCLRYLMSLSSYNICHGVTLILVVWNVHDQWKCQTAQSVVQLSNSFSFLIFIRLFSY